MKRYDLHIHTNYSKCSFNKPKEILRIAKKKGLNGIAITDHHTIMGALKVKELNKDKKFEVIVGEEITTKYGDIVGLYLKEEIKTRDLFQAIKEIRKQKGLVFIPHPYRPVPWLKFKYPLNKLGLDALETVNSRNFRFANKKADRKAKALKVAELGNSDAHIPIDIGQAYTEFEGDLRQAIKRRKTKAYGSTKYTLVSGMSAFIGKRILSKLGFKKCP